MKNDRKLPISMTGTQLWLGLIYLIAMLFALPGLLTFANSLLPVPLSAAWINFIFFFLNFICILLIFHRFLWQSLGYSLQVPGLCLFSALRGYIGYYLGTFVVGLFIMWVEPSFVNVNDMSIAATTQDNFRVMAVGTVLLVPLVEELLYRGTIFGALHRKSRLAAYCVSTVVFSLVHVIGYIGTYEWKVLALCFLQYVPAGLCLGWAYERSGSIFAPILIHTTVNAMGIFVMR